MILANISFDLSAIDGFALTVTVVGYVIVFLALVVLYYVYTLMPKVIQISIRKKLRRQGKEKHVKDEHLSIPGEVNAAISMALILYFSDAHDEESTVMTIKRVSKRYSPWSSKIYSLDKYHR
ncbi:MAG: OadG family protein [Bacteroidales bacterium]|nr:OadG family protein [Bacteroidales bacterium]MDZ4205485.1 OadG family protein [Bacteroidales bacterium]